VDTQYGTNIKFKLHDKLRALELLGKHLGMFVERHAGPEGGPIPVEHTFTDEAIKKAFDILYRG
jgi:phage terminase small subunit